MCRAVLLLFCRGLCVSLSHTTFHPATAPRVCTTRQIAAFMVYVSQQPLSSWWRSGPIASMLWATDSWLLSAVCPPFLCKVMSVQLRVGYLAAIAAFLFISLLMLLQRIFLRVLLHYRGWLFERKPGIVTKLWAVMLKGVFLAGRHPLLYSFQHALPRQPPPSVKDTITKFLASVRPVLKADEYAAIEADARKFQASDARKLQTLLMLKSWVTTNYGACDAVVAARARYVACTYCFGCFVVCCVVLCRVGGLVQPAVVQCRTGGSSTCTCVGGRRCSSSPTTTAAASPSTCRRATKRRAPRCLPATRWSFTA